VTHYDPRDPTARVSDHQVEVPGDPEDVWRAIATGPGIATWFVPAQVQEHEGGRIVTDHGPYGTSEGVVTAWEPPRRFAYEEREWDPEHPDAPPWATELLVTGGDGGTCVVRLVSGFFTGGDGWEENLKGTDEGWIAALRNLRLALTHFPGQPAAMLTVDGTVADRSPGEVGRELLAALGLAAVTAGEPVHIRAGTAAVAGVVVDTGDRSVTLRTDEPHPGILEFAVFDHDGATAAVRWYLYGPGGQEVAARETPRWTHWLGEHIAGVQVLDPRVRPDSPVVSVQ
jgi:uncharacterized protein YndB with AHSA1/START domain